MIRALMVKTQKELRELFWSRYPQYEKRKGFTQNDYPADVRMAWVDHVDMMQKSGQISEKLAERATL